MKDFVFNALFLRTNQALSPNELVMILINAIKSKQKIMDN
jgi:hypothetical protein